VSIYRASDINISVGYYIVFKNIIKKNITRRTNKSAIVTYKQSILILLINSRNIIKYTNGSLKEENSRGTSKLLLVVSTLL
jgi:hypothetical protein